MHSISPRQIELFHLRLLLIKLKGAISFEDIRTVNAIKYDTFHSACLALGLIEDDAECERAMTEGDMDDASTIAAFICTYFNILSPK